MQYAIAGLALAALAAAKPVPQTDSSCSSDYSGTFKIQVVQPTKAKRQSDDLELTMSLAGGILTDSEGRTGYIASNGQFQFDAPPQPNALTTSGFSVCGGFLAHDNGVTTWDSCESGDFSNLYSENSASYCKVVNIQAIGSDSTVAPATSAAAATTSAAATQLSDGQPQAPTIAPAPAVTQITDGQPQAPTSIAAPVTQISDGQPQAPTSAPIAPVTQISDGQPQAPTSILSPVTQISDGQVQAPTGTGALPYPGANTTIVGAAPTASVVPATGAASSFHIGSSVVGLVAAIAALAMC